MDPLQVAEEPREQATGLRANVTRAEALDAFSEAGTAGMYRRARIGRLRQVAEAHVPFGVYRVSYEDGRRIRTRLLAMEQVAGLMDLYEFDEEPREEGLAAVRTRNILEARLGEREAEERLREKVLRLIFQRGFFRAGLPRMQMERVRRAVYVPYWLGFYGEDGGLRCRAMDAVRRRMEGAKATELFEGWLREGAV